MRTDAESFEDVAEEPPDLDAVTVVEEDVAVVNAPIHHVMPAVVDVGAKCASHELIMTTGCDRDGTTRV
jgi:hypothetical protein